MSVFMHEHTHKYANQQLPTNPLIAPSPPPRKKKTVFLSFHSFNTSNKKKNGKINSGRRAQKRDFDYIAINKKTPHKKKKREYIYRNMFLFVYKYTYLYICVHVCIDK